jgi:hypothetical protein
MTPDIQKKLRQPRSHESLRVTHPHAAGIDVHADIHWVAVPPGDAPPPDSNHPPNLPAHVRSFGTCTADLIALVDWLAQCGVKTIADGQPAALVVVQQDAAFAKLLPKHLVLGSQVFNDLLLLLVDPAGQSEME